MRQIIRAAVALSLAAVMSAGIALAQGKPACDAQGRVKAAEKVEGQVVKIDQASGRVTVREADGTTHEFQGSKETLADLKPGDRIEAKLRESPKC